MSSSVTLSQFWERVQRGLFGWLEAELGALSGKQKQLVKILELLRVEDYVPRRRLSKGRPLEDRKALARAFVAKAVYNLETTRQLLERLGQDCYVLTDRPSKDLEIEHYFVPELGGGTPFKQVTAYKNGPKFVSEPVSVTLGEPAASDVTGPHYLTIEQEPIFLRNIGEQLLSKPDAYYPPEALSQGWSGSVNVAVTIDETGRVISAGAQPGNATQSLREAAVEAAYRASFKPHIVEGRPVLAKGIIDYQFVLPK